MIDAQQWLNQKFPTRESREKIKALCLEGKNGCLHSTYGEYTFAPGEQHIKLDLTGELDLREFPNLTLLLVRHLEHLSQIKLGQGLQLNKVVFAECPQLKTIVGLEHCPNLLYLQIETCPQLQPPYTFLGAWKQEIQALKAQLADYEQPETASDPSEPLNTKIQRKKAELSQAITNGRRSTAPLRKEIELLEKIQNLETQINSLHAKETNYQQQIRQKDQQINAKQSQITNLQSQATQSQRKITQLEKQITDLQAEKTALQEKMLKERQEALAQWEQEKATLQTQITQLNEQKDTFQKSADYLRSTLKDTEQTLTDTKNTLAQTQENAQQSHTNHQATLHQKDEELSKKQEAYSLIQERNTDLQAKLALAQEEATKLTQWISKLEAASAEGDALQTLQKELAQAQTQIQTLQEQLDAKNPRKNYLWLYAVLALIALYFLMS